MVSATDSVGSGLGEMLMLPVAHWWCQTSRVTVINLLATNFVNGNWSLANLPSVLKIPGLLVMSCSKASLEMPPLSFIAHFWKSKTWVSQSHRAHCRKVGIVPLIALRRKKEGRQLQYVVVDFVLKSISFFHGGRRREEYCKAGKLGLQMVWNPWNSLLCPLPGADSICSWR